MRGRSKEGFSASETLADLSFPVARGNLPVSFPFSLAAIPRPVQSRRAKLACPRLEVASLILIPPPF